MFIILSSYRGLGETRLDRRDVVSGYVDVFIVKNPFGGVCAMERLIASDEGVTDLETPFVPELIEVAYDFVLGAVDTVANSVSPEPFSARPGGEAGGWFDLSGSPDLYSRF